MKHLHLALTSTLLLTAAPLVASDPVESHGENIYLSYDDAARVALGENIDLLALRYQEDALKLRSKQALAPNNPVITLSKNDVPGLSPDMDSASQVYAVTYTLGFPGKSLSQSAALHHQAEAFREQALSKEIDLLTGLSNNYVAFAINEATRKLLLDERKRNQDLLKLLEKKFASSQAAKVDLLNAQVVVAQSQQAILVNSNEREMLTTQFRQIIRRPESKNLFPQIPTDIIIPKVSRSLDELSRIMLHNRHLLLASESQTKASRSTLTVASLAALPDFQLSGAMNVYNIPSAAPIPGVNRDYSMGIGIAIPLFFPFSEMTGVRAARRDLMAAEAQQESQRLNALSDLQTVYAGLSAASKEMDSLTKLMVPAAKASYDLLLLTYSLGKADYFRLNEARKTWMDAEKDMLVKKQNMAQLSNQLIQQIGCDIFKTEGPHACH